MNDNDESISDFWMGGNNPKFDMFFSRCLAEEAGTKHQ